LIALTVVPELTSPTAPSVEIFTSGVLMAFDLFEHNAQNETKNELETFTACSEHALAYVVF
jgi:hypothetical protein